MGVRVVIVKTSPASQVAAYARAFVRCATCGGKPEIAFRMATTVDGVVLTFMCHGATESLLVPLESADSIPSKVFLRRWARHGEASASARRERRELVDMGRRVA